MLRNAPAEIHEFRGFNSCDHLACIDRYASDLHHALFYAMEKCIPRIRQQASAVCPRIVGWIDECKKLKEYSSFWHKLWVDYGRPYVSVVADTIRATRRRYHLADPHLLRDLDNFKNTKLVDFLVNCRSNEFMRKVKRANCASSVPRSIIADHTTPLCLLQTRSKISTLPFYVATLLTMVWLIAFVRL